MNFYGTFLTPGMAVLDLVLSNDAGDDSYMIQGLTPMEKVAHGMHMIEMWQVLDLFIQNKVLIDNIFMWQKTSVAYRNILWVSDEVCHCLTDERNNGILQNLAAISTFMKGFGKKAVSRDAQMVYVARKGKAR